jgi:molybdate transport system substrate-binding protein
MRRRGFLVSLPGIGFALSPIGLQPPELLVLSSNALRAALDVLGPSFERSESVALVFRFAPSAELKALIDGRETFDVAFLAREVVTDLVALGRVDGTSRIGIARAGAGVAIRKGAKKPDLSTTSALRRALLEARSIAYVGQGVTADIVRTLVERFGISEEMGVKTTVLVGVTAAEAVASGQAELGFTQISEILGHPGVDLAGPLPPEVQVYTTFEGVVASNAREPEWARRFIQRLTSPASTRILRATGLLPG